MVPTDRRLEIGPACRFYEPESRGIRQDRQPELEEDKQAAPPGEAERRAGAGGRGEHAAAGRRGLHAEVRWPLRRSWKTCSTNWIKMETEE